MHGLGQNYWKEVIDVLSSIIPVYDKVNKVISLGQDTQFRTVAMRGNIFPGNTVLDAGSGFGNMSNIALQQTGNNLKIIMCDPIPAMLKKAVSNSALHGLSSGIFENLPFQSDSFDVVCCGYSLRDAINLEIAISEVYRVLRKGGRFIIVDLGKPDNVFFRLSVSFYLKYILGIFAFAAAGKKGLKFKTLYGTFLRWPKNSDLQRLLETKFSRINFQKRLFGGAIIVCAYK